MKAGRGRFYIEQIIEDESYEQETIVVGRITPLVTPRGKLLLEGQKSNANWYEVKKGTAEILIENIANDTKGTFHGLGALNENLYKSGGTQCQPIEIDDNFNFLYKNTSKQCSVQEALYHYFDIPIDIIAEPAEWYMYHRKPKIIEISNDKNSILVNFLSRNRYGSSFGGTCLYTKVHEDKWGAYTIKPNQSKNIESSLSWLEKSEWNSW